MLCRILVFWNVQEIVEYKYVIKCSIPTWSQWYQTEGSSRAALMPFLPVPQVFSSPSLGLLLEPRKQNKMCLCSSTVLIHHPVPTVKPLINRHLGEPTCIGVLPGLLPEREHGNGNRQTYEMPSLNQNSQTFATKGPLCRRRGFRLKFSRLFHQMLRFYFPSSCIAMLHFSFSCIIKLVGNIVKTLLGNNSL